MLFVHNDLPKFTFREPHQPLLRHNTNRTEFENNMLQAQLDLLVIEAQSGNTAAFECLVEYFHPTLIRFARSLTANPTLADDAVQEAWLSMIRKVKYLKDPRAFKSWLFKLVRWRLIDLTRVNNQTTDAFDENSLNTADSNDPVSHAIDESDIESRQLLLAISRLNSDEQLVIRMFYLIELSVSEIAAVLEIPVGTVKSRLNRARNQLKSSLEC